MNAKKPPRVCRLCGVDLCPCYGCSGIGYHEAGCPEMDGGA